MVFQQNLIEKAYFIAKMSGPTMVRPASSDFWKAPWDEYNNENEIFSIDWVLLAREPTSFWRENVIFVVTLLRVLARMS